MRETRVTGMRWCIVTSRRSRPRHSCARTGGLGRHCRGTITSMHAGSPKRETFQCHAQCQRFSAEPSPHAYTAASMCPFSDKPTWPTAYTPR